MAKPVDGVIEAVRYKNGQITAVRIYERRGAAYSDQVVLDRKTLLERMQKGQQFMTGARKELFGNKFDLHKAVKVIKQADREFIATRENVTHDELEQALFF